MSFITWRELFLIPCRNCPRFHQFWWDSRTCEIPRLHGRLWHFICWWCVQDGRRFHRLRNWILDCKHSHQLAFQQRTWVRPDILRNSGNGFILYVYLTWDTSGVSTRTYPNQLSRAIFCELGSPCNSRITAQHDFKLFPGNSRTLSPPGRGTTLTCRREASWQPSRPWRNISSCGWRILPRLTIVFPEERVQSFIGTISWRWGGCTENTFPTSEWIPCRKYSRGEMIK